MQPEVKVFEEHKGDYYVSNDPRKLDLEFVHHWLARESYWSREVPVEIVEIAIENSLCYGVYQAGGEQVGFGRLVTDAVTFAWVTDVFIIEEHRGKGLSRLLIKAVLAQPELQAVRRWLLGTEHAHGLYRKFGFVPLDHAENYLTLHRANMYSSGEYDQLLQDYLDKF